MVGWNELQRTAVVGLRLGDIELQRAIASHQQEASEGRLELSRLASVAGEAEELDRFAVVMGEDLGVVRDPVLGDALDPLRCGPVLRRACRARDLAVGDVAKKNTPEHVLRLACDGGAPGLLHELLPLEAVQQLLRLPARYGADCLERAQLEDFADDRGVLE